LILAYLLYYGLPQLGISMEPWTAGLLALIIYDNPVKDFLLIFTQIAQRNTDNKGRQGGGNKQFENQWGVIWSVRDSFIAGLFATLELFITAALAALMDRAHQADKANDNPVKDFLLIFTQIAQRNTDNKGRQPGALATGGIMNQWGVIWSVRDSFIAGLFATLELFITLAFRSAIPCSFNKQPMIATYSRPAARIGDSGS
jgi:hypothetical protein